MKIGMVSLGCAKNLVDSEMIMGLLKESNMEIVNDVDKADIIFINTCGFIESAKEEAINTILEMLDYQKDGKKIVVSGCLVERYKKDLEKSIPEVDLYVSIKEYPNIGKIFAEKFNIKSNNLSLCHQNRVLTSKDGSVYVRIADGCDNRCHFCAIPLIRGSYNSRSIKDIVSEVIDHVKNGKKEINLISQDTTRYGKDFKDGTTLVTLLKELVKIEGISMIRLLYLYPEEITDELIDFIHDNKSICRYFDVPIQHASNKMLHNMNRRGSKEFMIDLFDKIKLKMPDAILRTTLILGYPTETEDDHNELKDFISYVKFDRLGAFTYSKEEDTVGYNMKPVVNKNTAKRRYNEIMKIQKKIAIEQSKRFIGTKMDVLIEDYDFNELSYEGRSYAYAPDDIDGKIYVYSVKMLEKGNIYSVSIVDTDGYNLIGKIE